METMNAAELLAALGHESRLAVFRLLGEAGPEGVVDGAIEALKLARLPTAGLAPKDVDVFLDQEIDLVVSVCDNAKETCPVFPRPVARIHLPFHDPHGEPLESFIQVRDDIRARLVPAVMEALGLERKA